MKLKLRVYEEIVEACRSAGDAQSNLRSFVFKFANDVSLRRKHILMDSPPTARFDALSALFDAASFKSIGIISLVERWLIVEPRLELFKTAMNVALHELREAHSREYVQLAAARFPKELQETPGGLIWALPNESDATALQKGSERFIRSIDLLGCFTDDFQREMQNLLLGELFSGNKVTPREPIDPYFIAVRSDQYAALMHHFENATDWGRDKQRSEARAREALRKQG